MLGNPTNTFDDIKKYINDSYQNNTTDEFLLPALNSQYPKQDIALNDNDAIIFANFRPDRARELSHCIFGSQYYDYVPNIRKQNLFFVTLMTYEGIVPSSIAYPQVILKNTFGEVISKNNLSQLRVAETEKYAHVTFFFDGGVEIVYPHETKIIVPSPKVATYDLQPQMSANEVCEKILQYMDKTDVIIANFANGDMVGHTGNLQASIKAVETIDACLAKIYEKSLSTQTTLFITADHGNADMVIDDNNKPVTAHTLNPVPFVVTDKNIKLNPNGKLANIAPTILQYLGINIPNEMNETPLITKK
jgi:2,3-bisphosphoglycerate-independent phosphoglycerate mutase